MREAQDEYVTIDGLGRTYLDSAAYGLPPASTAQALRDALTAWEAGAANWVDDWDGAGDACRELVAPLLGAPVDEISLQPAVSVAASIVLSSLRAGDEVVVPRDEFASVLLPALTAAEQHGATVRRVAFEALADSLMPQTALVISSHVRSNDGRVQDLTALADGAAEVGARVLLDTTHSAGILPLNAAAQGIDFVVAAAYKHLLCPRGVAFLRVPERLFAEVVPLAASWRAARAPYDYYYGPRLSDLATTAARYDVSLAWHAWFGAQRSLQFLASMPSEAVRAWCVGLAAEFADQMGVAPTGSSVIAVQVRDGEAAREALRAAGIVVSSRDNGLRLSFHVYNDSSQVAAAARVLRRHLAR